MTDTIDGPLGPFKIPTSAHPRTREVCEYLSRQVFGDAETLGEYDSPELPAFNRVTTTKAEGDPVEYTQSEYAVILDVGSSWGPFTCWAYAKWPGSVIHCYEPHDEASSVFVQNVATIPHGHVALYRVAVTIDPAPKINGCEDFGAYHVASVDDTCARPVVGLHPRDLPRCDILKVDIEGGEVDLLEHYPHLATCRALLIEFHSFEKRERVTAVALDAGFVRAKAAPENASYGVDVWTK